LPALSWPHGSPALSCFHGPACTASFVHRLFLPGCRRLCRCRRNEQAVQGSADAGGRCTRRGSDDAAVDARRGSDDATMIRCHSVTIHRRCSGVDAATMPRRSGVTLSQAIVESRCRCRCHSVTIHRRDAGVDAATILTDPDVEM
jgi:hypothetical protein